MTRLQWQLPCLIFALFVLFFGLSANGQETEGGGLISETPSWMVRVKSSETPFRGDDGFYEFTGTGTWIAKDLVLTCWHNWRYKRTTKISPEVCIEDHNGNRYTNVEIAAVDKEVDILVVRVKGEIHDHTSARVSTEPQTSGAVVSYGFDTVPTRIRWSVGEVLLKGSGKPVRRGKSNGVPVYHVHDGLVVQGMSGGPGFDDSGELQLVNIGHYKGESTAVSLSVIQRVLDTINP